MPTLTKPTRSSRKTTSSTARSTVPATFAPARAVRPRAVTPAEQDEHDSLLKVEGVVTSMIRILEHFTVRDNSNNRNVRLTWTPKTRFVRKGKSAAANVLRIGQPVSVSCDLADKGGLLAEVVAISS